MNEWVSVEKRLPEENQMVIAYTPVDGFQFIGFQNTYGYPSGKTKTKWYIITAMRSIKTITKKVSHWMPLPMPPEEPKEIEYD